MHLIICQVKWGHLFINMMHTTGAVASSLASSSGDLGAQVEDLYLQLYICNLYSSMMQNGSCLISPSDWHQNNTQQTRSTWRAKTSLAEADHHSHMSQ